jgi:hypothetical protein
LSVVGHRLVGNGHLEATGLVMFHVN